VFPKLDYDPADLRLALVDASGGKIGTFLDRFTLWCYHPTDSGKYVISPMAAMRVGAGLSAAVLMGFVGLWAGRDYFKRRNSKRRISGGGCGGWGSGAFQGWDMRRTNS